MYYRVIITRLVRHKDNTQDYNMLSSRWESTARGSDLVINAGSELWVVRKETCKRKSSISLTAHDSVLRSTGHGEIKLKMQIRGL